MATERLAITDAIADVGVPGAGVAAAAAQATRRSLGAARRRQLAYAVLKRALDVTVAALMLLALAPLLAAIALAIRLDSGGPALFRQERVGQNGRRFTLVKFRSMRAHADTAPHRELIRTLLRDGVAPCAVYKVAGDSRITRVGAFLRRTSLDELPQLWNVLRGDMSLVGPRPDVPYAFEEYADWMQRRLLVKPGITGLWQVSGRSRVSLNDMYRLDADYVARASFLLDLEILVRTVPAVLTRDGAA